MAYYKPHKKLFAMDMAASLLVAVMRRYKKCPSDKVMVVYGNVGSNKDGTSRTILGLLRKRMNVRRSKIDRRLNGGIQTFKRHDKRTADDNRRPFASVESQPRAKHNYCNGSSEMDAHVPLALHRRGNA